MFIRRLPPRLMFNGPEATGSSSPPAPASPAAPAAPAAPAVPAAPAAPAAPAPAAPAAPAPAAPAAPAPPAPAAPAAPPAPTPAAPDAAAPPPPGVPAEVEAELRELRANLATLSGQAAETMQLRYANEHGITKTERVLLTAATDEALAAQVAAVIAMRAPSTASAQAAGITGGGTAPVVKPTTIAGAIKAHYEAQN